jgi:hypothetical protein
VVASDFMERARFTGPEATADSNRTMMQQALGSPLRQSPTEVCIHPLWDMELHRAAVHALFLQKLLTIVDAA